MGKLQKIRQFQNVITKKLLFSPDFFFAPLFLDSEIGICFKKKIEKPSGSHYDLKSPRVDLFQFFYHKIILYRNINYYLYIIRLSAPRVPDGLEY